MNGIGGRGIRCAEAFARRRVRFSGGMVLLVASFAVYPAYAAIALMPVPTPVKVAGGAAGAMLGWLCFALGCVLVRTARSKSRDAERRMRAVPTIEIDEQRGEVLDSP